VAGVTETEALGVEEELDGPGEAKNGEDDSDPQMSKVLERNDANYEKARVERVEVAADGDWGKFPPEAFKADDEDASLLHEEADALLQEDQGQSQDNVVETSSIFSSFVEEPGKSGRGPAAENGPKKSPAGKAHNGQKRMHIARNRRKTYSTSRENSRLEEGKKTTKSEAPMPSNNTAQGSASSENGSGNIISAGTSHAAAASASTDENVQDVPREYEDEFKVGGQDILEVHGGEKFRKLLQDIADGMLDIPEGHCLLLP